MKFWQVLQMKHWRVEISVMQVAKEKYLTLKKGVLGDRINGLNISYLCLRCFLFILLEYACLQCKLKASNSFILIYICHFPLLSKAYKNRSILRCIFYMEIIWCRWLWKDFLSLNQLFHRGTLHSCCRIYKLIYSEIHFYHEHTFFNRWSKLKSIIK